MMIQVSDFFPYNSGTKETHNYNVLTIFHYFQNVPYEPAHNFEKFKIYINKAYKVCLFPFHETFSNGV